MNDKEWLSELKPGDDVIIARSLYGEHTWNLDKVEKITKTLIVVGKFDRFRLRDGHAPGDGWHKPWLIQATQENITRAKLAKEKILLNRKIGEIKFKNLTNDALKEIIGIAAAELPELLDE